jgi:hypothetical protein
MTTRKFTSSSETPGYPSFAERSGQLVEVIRELTDIDFEEVGPMFRIRFADGVETSAFDDELTDAPTSE